MRVVFGAKILMHSPQYLIFFSLFLLVNSAYSDTKNVRHGMLDFNLYPLLSNVDSDSVATINIAAQLNHGFSYFSLTNLYNQPDSSELSDTTGFYTEQNIRWQISNSAFDVTSQFNFRTGENNDRHRLGIRWRLNNSPWLESTFDHLHLAWSINVHLIQIDDTDANEWQLEHVFRLTAPAISKRLYLAGFIDQTFGEDLPNNTPNNPVVGEAQLGYRVLENLYLVTEYRVNQYRLNNVENLAAGFEYKLLW